MSEIAATLGLPVTFTYAGKEYQVAGRDFTVEGLFVTWCEANALKAIQRHKEELGPTGVAIQMDGWRRDCAAHAYDWDGLECWQARISVPGRKHLAALQLCKAGMPMPQAEALVDEVFEDAEARQALEDAMVRADADPNRARRRRRAAPA
jgi:hypothetical protein